MNNYSHCRFQPEGLLCDAERDLLCDYVFAIGFPLYVPKNVLGGFEDEDVKMLCSNPQKARVCWCIACQNWFNGRSYRSVERFCVQTEKGINKKN